MISDNKMKLLILYALLLFISSFYLDGVLIGLGGSSLIVIGANRWGLRGGSLSAAYSSTLLVILYFFSNYNLTLERLLGTSLAMFIFGISLGISIEQFKKKEKEIVSKNEKNRELIESLLVMEQAMSTSINALALADLNGSLTYVNTSFLKMWGFESDRDVIGQSALDFWHDKNEAQQVVESLLKSGSWAGDLVAKRRDNELFYVHLLASLVYDTQKRPIKLMASFIDMTDRKKAEIAVQKSEEKYRTIVENTNDGLLIHDFKGNINDLNENACQIFGYKRSELMGSNLSKIHSKKDRELAYHRLEQLKELTVLVFEVEGKRKDSSSIPLEVSARTITSENGGIIQSFVRDITERKETEKQLKNYTTEMELRNMELESLYQYLNTEIDKALKIHKRTLPKAFPQSQRLLFHAFYQPAEKMGGDFFDIIRKGTTYVSYVSDVTGHGLESAFLSSFVKDMVHSYMALSPEKDITPSNIIHFLNRQYRERNFPEDFFVCIFLTVINTETMELQYLGAGIQDFPLLYQDGELKELSKGGLPISAAYAESLLNFEEGFITLKNPSALLLSTDGITEHYVGDTPYGDRLKDTFIKNVHQRPHSIVEAIKEDFMEFNRGSLQGYDDITFLVIQTKEDV